MRVSTIIILAIGIFLIAWAVIGLAYSFIAQPPSWDIGIPWGFMILEAGMCFTGAGLLKWILLDRWLGLPF